MSRENLIILEKIFFPKILKKVLDKKLKELYNILVNGARGTKNTLRKQTVSTLQGSKKFFEKTSKNPLTKSKDYDIICL